MLLITDEELEDVEPAPQQPPDYEPRATVMPGVRARLKHWLESNNQSELISQCQCVGLRYNQLFQYANSLHELPSLRTALSLELLTKGQVRVHDWVEVMELKQQAIENMKSCTQAGIKQIANLQWPPQYSDDIAKRLRWELARRLTRPEDNILGIVAQMGKHKIQRTERLKALGRTTLTPPVVSPDATEEEVEREIYLYRRARSKRDAYKSGTRNDF